MSNPSELPNDEEQAPPSGQPATPRSGAAPSASHYVTELPLAEELQAVLGGEYVVENFLGQGGMGAVYQGWQMPLRRPVAIKILMRRQAGEGDAFAFEDRFKREAYAMAALTHPHIVQVYDCGDAGEHFLFISMELVEGGDLSEAIKEGRVTPDVALKLILQICDGLQYAHEHGLVHRDIKPANIFLTKEGRAKVADFGLAKKFDSQSTFATKTGMSMGTPDYAAPEQFDAVEDIDHRADIYSLGVMMYQMFTGRLPRGNYRPASQYLNSDSRIDAILGKAMEIERADRYRSVAELKADIVAITAPAPRSTAVAVSAVTTTSVPVAPPRTAAPVARPAAPAPRSVAAPVSRPAPEPLKKQSSMGVLIAIGGTIAVLAVGAYFALRQPAARPLDVATPAATVSIPGLPDLPPLALPPGEPGFVKEMAVPGGFLHNFALLPDSRRLLTFQAGPLKLWDLETEKVLWTVSGVDHYRSHALTPDGSKLVHCGIQGERAVIVLRSTADGSVIQEWRVPVTTMSNAYGHVALSPSGKRVVARVGNATVKGGAATGQRIYVALEVGRDQPIAEWTHPSHNGHSVSALDEDRYVSTGEGSLLLRISEPGNAKWPFADASPRLTHALSLDRRHLAAKDQGDRLAVWDLETGKSLPMENGPKSANTIQAFAGQHQVVSVEPENRGQIEVWDRASGKKLATLAVPQPGLSLGDFMSGAANGAFCVVRVKKPNLAPGEKEPPPIQIYRLPKPGAAHKAP